MFQNHFHINALKKYVNVIWLTAVFSDLVRFGMPLSLGLRDCTARYYSLKTDVAENRDNVRDL